MGMEGESTGATIGTGAADQNPQTQKEQKKEKERARSEGSRAFESRNPTEEGKKNEMNKFWE